MPIILEEANETLQELNEIAMRVAEKHNAKIKTSFEKGHLIDKVSLDIEDHESYYCFLTIEYSNSFTFEMYRSNVTFLDKRFRVLNVVSEILYEIEKEIIEYNSWKKSIGDDN